MFLYCVNIEQIFYHVLHLFHSPPVLSGYCSPMWLFENLNISLLKLN